MEELEYTIQLCKLELMEKESELEEQKILSNADLVAHGEEMEKLRQQYDLQQEQLKKRHDKQVEHINKKIELDKEAWVNFCHLNLNNV